MFDDAIKQLLGYTVACGRSIVLAPVPYTGNRNYRRYLDKKFMKASVSYRSES